jgi:hypothetical protein
MIGFTPCGEHYISQRFGLLRMLGVVQPESQADRRVLATRTSGFDLADGGLRIPEDSRQDERTSR